jgi:hypothetical protein
MFDHLQQANKTYTSHFSFAMKNGLLLLYAGVISLVHAIWPGVFKFTSRDIVLQIAQRITDN